MGTSASAAAICSADALSVVSLCPLLCFILPVCVSLYQEWGYNGKYWRTRASGQWPADMPDIF
jgi:hypothetical protein